MTKVGDTPRRVGFSAILDRHPRVVLTVLVFIGMVFTILAALVGVKVQGHVARIFAPHVVSSSIGRFPLIAWFELIALAAWSGIAFAWRAGNHVVSVAASALALLGGGLVPMGLFGLGLFLDHFWQSINHPVGRSCALVVIILYCLLAPWILGRALLARWEKAR